MVLFLIQICSNLSSQNKYKYKDEELTFAAIDSIYFIQCKSLHAEEKEKEFVTQLKNGRIKSYQKITDNRYIVQGDLIDLDSTEYYSHIYIGKNSEQIIVLPRIVLMIEKKMNISHILKGLEKICSIESASNGRFILKCNLNSSKDVFELVNLINNQRGVIWCEPEFLGNYKNHNTLYPLQYYLNNTGQENGQAGIDINIEPAWGISNGCNNVTVAVIDDGVDNNHEDFGDRVSKWLYN